MKERIVMIGSSLGGLDAMRVVLGGLRSTFPHPIVAVQHRHRTSQGKTLAQALKRSLALNVVDAEDKLELRPGCVVLAPADYHLLVEHGRVALSVDAPVHFSRPSIDVAFESGAASYGSGAVGVLLTGSNSDGAEGCHAIHTRGGSVVVQDPEEAEAPQMPLAAIERVPSVRVMKLAEIARFLTSAFEEGNQ